MKAFKLPCFLRCDMADERPGHATCLPDETFDFLRCLKTTSRFFLVLLSIASSSTILSGLDMVFGGGVARIQGKSPPESLIAT